MVKGLKKGFSYNANEMESKSKGIIQVRSLATYFLSFLSRYTKNKVTPARYRVKLIPSAKTSLDQTPHRKMIKNSDKTKLVITSILVASDLFSMLSMLALKDRICHLQHQDSHQFK